MDLGIAGRIAFISGGSRGLGRATALLLAREGVRIVIAARAEDAIDETVTHIRETGGEAALIGFLCSEGGGYMTGQMLTLDGGFSRSAW